MANYTLNKTGSEIDDLLAIVDDAPNNTITSGSDELVTSGTIHTHVASQVAGAGANEVTTAPTGQTMATSGSTTLGGGLIMKFGSFVSTSDSDETFTYPVAFPTNVFSVVFSNVGSGGGAYSVHPKTFSTSGFVVNRSDDLDGSFTINFIAIGN